MTPDDLQNTSKKEGYPERDILLFIEKTGDFRRVIYEKSGLLFQILAASKQPLMVRADSIIFCDSSLF